MRVTEPRAAAVALDNATTILAERDWPMHAKIMGTVVTLAEGTDTPGPWSETDLAEMAGMSRHQARQAIASLVAIDYLERGWNLDGAKPERRYRVKVEA